jgi:predicted N-acetyltransferase YhbS
MMAIRQTGLLALKAKGEAMDTRIRSYDHAQDYERVSQFLIDMYRPDDYLPLWLQPRWEYMHYHSLINETDLTKIGLVEAARQLVGVVHHEHSEGWIYFQVHPDFEPIKPMMFDYAETIYGARSKNTGQRQLHVFINEADENLRMLAKARGYTQMDEVTEVMSRYLLDQPMPQVELPAGFSLKRLQEENDLRKINRVLWRGFNHPGPPPEDEIPGRRLMQQAPNFRLDLTVVAVAPDGNFVSYCGIWYVPENQVTYVEPVATDPDYRRLGLGSAVVLEGIRQTAPLGAQAAWVGSDQAFYMAMGFQPMFTAHAWAKNL